eukprot:TRINITY_DN35784_c0_g1_i2.p1 TRINITY_DN35784_c0_g1~~TRINITY_DN35784_c0_g1_i2.p1  ORF type:complete len:210 (+),score=31.30 TRINITY_DN35784_c0_g1_i2:87-716(+)
MGDEEMDAKKDKERRKLISARHDCFNLFTIPPLVVLTGLSMARPSKTSHSALSWSVLTYTLFDTVYNLLVPECQPNLKRWATIMLHHVTASWLTLFPIAHPELGHLTSYCTIVEVNTMCLTFAKALKSKFWNNCHLGSWVALRLFWYPYLVFYFHKVVSSNGIQVGDYEYLQTVGSQTVLCSLNYVWTAEVVAGMLRSKTKEGKDSKLR